jgi:hypothetical protein
MVVRAVEVVQVDAVEDNDDDGEDELDHAQGDGQEFVSAYE